jgi:putative spermidine/putrescine transport system ATP-binding protein
MTLPVWIVSFAATSGNATVAVSMLALIGTWVLLSMIVVIDMVRSRRVARRRAGVSMTVEEALDAPARNADGVRVAARGASVSLERPTRRFGSTLALDDLSLAIEQGELVALLGLSGCGKTTALRVLAGFERLDAGRVLVDGKDVGRLSAQKRDMGMVFQSYSLFPNMTARENVAFGLRMRHQRAAARRQKAQDHLDLVGLADQMNKYPHQMSGGQQQRVALARALAIEPSVLLLDEPLSALDAKVRTELRDQIRQIQRRLKITTVFVTHDQEEALSMADRVCVMREGRIEQVATPAVLYAAPTTPFVAGFVGVSSRVPVERVGTEVRVLGSVCTIRPGSDPPSGERVDALLRPEDIEVTPNRDGAGTVIHTSFLGSTIRLDVLVGSITMKVDVRSDSAETWALSTRVDVTSRAKDVLLVAPLDGRDDESGAPEP